METLILECLSPSFLWDCIAHIPESPINIICQLFGPLCSAEASLSWEPSHPIFLFSCILIKGSKMHISSVIYRASMVAQTVKNQPATLETWFPSLGWEDPLEKRHGNPLQYSCPENPHGQRSLAGYTPWGCKVLDTTE